MLPELLARTAEHWAKHLPFVLYRKPGETIVRAILQRDAQLHLIGDYSEKGFVFAPFAPDLPTILLKSDEEFTADYLHTATHYANNSAPPMGEAPQKVPYTGLVQRAIEKIQEGTLEKVVISRRMEIALEDSPLDLFQRLLPRYASAFCYLWYHPHIGMWLGASPETLLKVENNRFSTMSLAGTQPYQTAASPFWKEKEVLEQGLVTRYILEALGSKVSEIQVKETESVRAGNLWHLCSQITGVLNGPLSGILSALHPTPAVCGLPLKEAQQFILENEGYPREYYTGFLGELHMKKERKRSVSGKNIENRAYRSVKTESHLFVNLRCMQVMGQKALLYIGGGVTKDSVPMNEWQETVEKSSTMLSVLGQK